MLGSNEVYVVNVPNILKLDQPFSQLLWSQILAIPLMGNIMILTENAAKIAAREKDGTTAIVALNARF
jgi:hypothetical protein